MDQPEFRQHALTIAGRIAPPLHASTAGWRLGRMLADVGAMVVSRNMLFPWVLSAAGWSLMWAQALSLVHVVPNAVAAACFLGGLALIPFCKSDGRRKV